MNSPPPEPEPAAPASILIVDDTPANLQVLTGMLKDRGYKVRPVPGGRLALAAARRDPPDLVLLDINMPEMNGYEVCEHFKADATLRGIPVIFISALTEPVDKVRAFGTGGVDYLTKPFQMEELHARVETHLKIRRLQVALEQANGLLARTNERMSHDLRAAAAIQRTFLPNTMPAMPGLAFGWAYRPCDDLAGDGLNVVDLGDGRVGVCVFDVSGHGVGAALLSVTLSRLLSRPGDPSSILIRPPPGAGPSSPAEVADRLNRLFPFDAATHQFTTLLYGIVDAGTGEFRHVAAGHPGPVHLPAGRPPTSTDTPGFPIGVGDEAYEERVVQLRGGDRLYLYSDGVIEAMSPGGEVFGTDRLLLAVDRSRDRPVQEGVDALLTDIDLWRGGGRPSDDLSILAVDLVPTAANTPAGGTAAATT